MREEDFPAEYAQAQEDPRVSAAHALPGRAEADRPTPGQGSRQALGLIWRVRDRATFAALGEQTSPKSVAQRRGKKIADLLGRGHGATQQTAEAEAAAGTVRKLYAESKGRNAIHASDSDENADRESRFFFAETDVIRG